MPELPEVEVICRGLRPLLVGRTINKIDDSGKRLRHPIPLEAMRQQAVNQAITTVTRRAKYLQIHLANNSMIIIHLGMTGNLGIFSPTAVLAKHDHVIWTLNNGTELRYNDIRRFGSIRFLSSAEVTEVNKTIFQTTGPEPFSDEFSAAHLQEMTKDKNVAVKQYIMTNQVVAGIGNIYANESLFAAGIRPARKVRTLTSAEWRSLIRNIRQVLTHAIECGGSTISDYRNAGQERGYFQMNFNVYGREGSPCYRCSGTIAKIKIGGRASYYCPDCQK